LKERLTFTGKIGCGLCILGALLIILHSPDTKSTENIREFCSLATKPGIHHILTLAFVAYAAIMMFLAFACIFKYSKKYNKSPMVYIIICSIFGSFTVVATQGLGSSIVHSISTHSSAQMAQWEFWVTTGFVLSTTITQVVYLNRALNDFSTAIVTPIYYVTFTSLTLVCSGILLGMNILTSTVGFLSLIIGFFVIVCGVALLFQLSIQIHQGTSNALPFKHGSLGRGSAAFVPKPINPQPYNGESESEEDVIGNIHIVAGALVEPMEVTLPKPCLNHAASRNMSLPRSMSIRSNNGVNSGTL
jgi:hypothetical protein